MRSVGLVHWHSVGVVCSKCTHLRSRGSGLLTLFASVVAASLYFLLRRVERRLALSSRCRRPWPSNKHGIGIARENTVTKGLATPCTVRRIIAFLSVTYICTNASRDTMQD